MVKADIIDTVYERIGFTRREAAEAVDLIFYIIREALINGENVSISGFGSFNVKLKNERPGRNPKTGSNIVIPSRRALSFRPAEKFKELVKKNR